MTDGAATTRRRSGRSGLQMWRSSVAQACLACVLGNAMAAVLKDKITDLPGYPGKPKTDQYSGAMTVSRPSHDSMAPALPSTGSAGACSTSRVPAAPDLAMLAGYLEVDDPQGKMYYHYWLATSQSE